MSWDRGQREGLDAHGGCTGSPVATLSDIAAEATAAASVCQAVQSVQRPSGPRRLVREAVAGRGTGDSHGRHLPARRHMQSDPSAGHDLVELETDPGQPWSQQ